MRFDWAMSDFSITLGSAVSLPLEMIGDSLICFFIGHKLIVGPCEGNSAH